ncbi:MAG: DNA mismatch repair endonuclease MutL [Intestinibacillus sp.]
MAVIHELSPHLADLIAAGEVVERPASVAKELVENAIDAGATRITVEMENGGVTYLRIADDGCGIAPEDAPVAFRRHATSKLRTEADLSAIGTLGFRGEALAAIASVSRIDLLTKQRGALAGTHLRLEAGQITENEDAGCPEGTTLIIRDLFFNTPARMKFLKKDFTEAGYIMGVVQHAALSHPEIAFTLIRDGKQIFSSAGDGKLMTPVFGVFGREMTEIMLEIAPFERNGLRAWGYITKPHSPRPNRGMQHFFVNNRYVKNKVIQAALEEAYRNRIITGKYPSCALFLSLPFHMVDVNVHPAKTEVKFAQEKQIFETIYIACKNTLEQDDNVPEIREKKVAVREDHVTAEQQRLMQPAVADTPAAQPVVEPAQAVRPMISAPERKPFGGGTAAWQPPVVECDDFEDGAPVRGSVRQAGLPIAKADSALHRMPHATGKRASVQTDTPEVFSLPQMESETLPERPQPETRQDSAAAEPFAPSARVLGEAFHTYIVAEDADGLLLIDKHAAHERMIFNRLRQTEKPPTQLLLTPVIAELHAARAGAVLEHLDEVRAAGFDIEPFGAGSFAVRAAPAYLDSADIAATLDEIAEKLLTSRAPVSDRLDDLIHTVACKAAIKAGKHSSMAEMQDVCARVLSDPEITCCPHGRPVMVRLTRYELDKLFKRVNQ